MDVEQEKHQSRVPFFAGGRLALVDFQIKDATLHLCTNVARPANSDGDGYV